MLPVLGADPARGLTEEEAARRLERHGPNIVPAPARLGVAHRVLRQLSDPMLLLLLGAAALTIWQGDAADTAVIALVVVLNTAVGVAQELRAEQAVAALQQMASPTARVVRGGVTGPGPATTLQAICSERPAGRLSGSETLPFKNTTAGLVPGIMTD